MPPSFVVHNSLHGDATDAKTVGQQLQRPTIAPQFAHQNHISFGQLRARMN